MLRELSLLDWSLLISTGITGGLGHLFQIAAYRRAPASTLAPFIYLQIISATTVGWLVWGHFPDPLTWLGIAVICASGMGIGLVEWRRGRRRHLRWQLASVRQLAAPGPAPVQCRSHFRFRPAGPAPDSRLEARMVQSPPDNAPPRTACAWSSSPACAVSSA